MKIFKSIATRALWYCNLVDKNLRVISNINFEKITIKIKLTTDQRHCFSNGKKIERLFPFIR